MHDIVIMQADASGLHCKMYGIGFTKGSVFKRHIKHIIILSGHQMPQSESTGDRQKDLDTAANADTYSFPASFRNFSYS